MKYGLLMFSAVMVLVIGSMAMERSPRPMDCAGDCVENCSNQCPNDSECYQKCLNRCLKGCNLPDVPPVPEPKPVPEPEPDGTAGPKSALEAGALCCYDGDGNQVGSCPGSLPWLKSGSGLCYATERQCREEAPGDGACWACTSCR